MSVCEKRVSFQALVEYTYRHIWYLISWVSKREYAAVCSHCGNGIHLDAAEAKRMFPNDGIPFLRKKGWLVGLVLVVLLGGVGMAGNAKDQETYGEFLASPQVGDVYLANLSTIEDGGYENAGPFAYGSMILVDMQDDMLVFVLSKEASNKKRGARKALSSLTMDGYDLEAPVGLTRAEARDMLDKEIICEIRRK